MLFRSALCAHKATQVTDTMSDCLYPVFGRSGKYLFFTASTDTGLSAGWLDMTSEAHPVTRSVYVAVLRSDLPSPLAPRSDEEKVKNSDKGKAKQPEKAIQKGKAKGGKATEKTPDVRIDFDGILQRTLALPIAAANYAGLFSGKAGQLYLVEAPIVSMSGAPAPLTVRKFDLKKRKTTKLLGGVGAFVLSSNEIGRASCRERV